MAQRFVSCDREQSFLMPPDVREWLPEGHLAWFVIDSVEEMDLDAFYAAYRQDGRSRPAYDSRQTVAAYSATMVMRWLTRDWHGSGNTPLTDAEVGEHTAAYQRHREAVLPQLPDELKTLAGQPIDGEVRSLHDGRVEAWEVQLPDRFVLQIVCGDLGHGYERVSVEYRGVELIGASEHDLAAWLGNERTELLYQEVDAVPGGPFEHRHLLWPQGEFGIRFNDISVTATTATPEEYDRANAQPQSSRPADPPTP